MDMDEAIHRLSSLGLYARHTPFSEEKALFVSRPDLRFEGPDDLYGWKASFIFLAVSEGWVVMMGSHGMRRVKEVAFSSLEDAAKYVHSKFDLGAYALDGDED
jgi:hypothetical protein